MLEPLEILYINIAGAILEFQQRHFTFDGLPGEYAGYAVKKLATLTYICSYIFVCCVETT